MEHQSDRAVWLERSSLQVPSSNRNRTLTMPIDEIVLGSSDDAEEDREKKRQKKRKRSQRDRMSENIDDITAKRAPMIRLAEGNDSDDEIRFVEDVNEENRADATDAGDRVDTENHENNDPIEINGNNRGNVTDSPVPCVMEDSFDEIIHQENLEQAEKDLGYFRSNFRLKEEKSFSEAGSPVVPTTNPDQLSDADDSIEINGTEVVTLSDGEHVPEEPNGIQQQRVIKQEPIYEEMQYGWPMPDDVRHTLADHMDGWSLNDFFQNLKAVMTNVNKDLVRQLQDGGLLVLPSSGSASTHRPSETSRNSEVTEHSISCPPHENKVYLKKCIKELKQAVLRLDCPELDDLCSKMDKMMQSAGRKRISVERAELSLKSAVAILSED